MRAVFILLCLFCAVARADDFLKSSPGELSKSHGKLDSQDQCSTCHEPDNSISANKCLGCHEHDDLKQRIARGEGFHVSPLVKGRPCKLCHQEHRGRGFDLMGWAGIGGVQGFDHKLTGWPLEGKHEKVDCTTCHKTTNKAQGLRTYMGTERLCGSCHAKDQPHGAIRKANMMCSNCHTQNGWRPQKTTFTFNHDDKAQAAMPLEGAHADVACSKCHVKAQFKLAGYTGSCEQCHKSPHAGTLFATKKCELCHSPAFHTLKQVHFDHKRDAKYALVGKHADIACESCHTKALGAAKPKESCETCHAKDSRHGTRFAKIPACSTCHTQRAWKAGFVFNHGANTGWELTDKHAKATCRDCHRGKSPSDFERFDIKNGCMSCHRHAKAHGGQYRNDQCLTCHSEGGSKVMKKDSLETFHGEGSRFPLHGGHANIKCALCHINDVFQGTPTECGSAICHEDSLHKGSLGPQCSRCHEGGQWTATRFDHKEDTKWPLLGKHAEVKDCELCHAKRQFKDAPTQCVGCHQKDDIHKGKLGTACEKCHAVDGKSTFQHNRDAQFKIDGAHVPLKCGQCHTSMEFKPIRKDCFGCHPEPAVHKGMYGTQCESCHNTKTFGDLKAQHDVGDFSLTGAHDQLDCARCHPHGEKLRGSGNLCITCHRKDDIHQNALSPRCGECHTQRSFAPARFDHMSVGCNLMGLHQTLPCADCHRNGNYGAVSPLCVSCHRTDALRVRQPDHRQFPFDCGQCHNPSAWIPATQLGTQSICR